MLLSPKNRQACTDFVFDAESQESDIFKMTVNRNRANYIPKVESEDIQSTESRRNKKNELNSDI